MESEIWKFRTRSGEYRIRMNSDHDEGADETLKAHLGAIKKRVLEGADMKATSFYGLDNTPNKHSQHLNGKHILPTTSFEIEDTLRRRKRSSKFSEVKAGYSKDNENSGSNWFVNSVVRDLFKLIPSNQESSSSTSFNKNTPQAPSSGLMSI